MPLHPLFVGEWIEATGHTQKAVKDATGLSQGYLANLSGGARRNPSAAVLRLIAGVIGVRADDFYLKPPKETDAAGLRRISADARESLHQARAETRRPA